MSTPNITPAKKVAAKKVPAKKTVVENPAEETSDTNWPLILGVIFGVIATIVWWRIDFGRYVFADSWWAGLMAGFATFAFVWAILPRRHDDLRRR